jgi:hypothetical protein
MKQQTTRILYNYWNEVRRQRLAPMRFEIEPSAISGILSETFILERDDAGRYPFRLAGTRICEQFGQELRGRDIGWLAGGMAQPLGRIMEAVTREGGVAVIETEAASTDGQAVVFEVIVLPLVHPTSEVTRYLGAVSAIQPPDWLGHEMLEPTGLVGHEIIWPDGRPHTVAEKMPNQLPFSPLLASARVVRSERRQFRILDGGRKE